jgi:branched-chain amino acid transport system ATP-binding protein
VRLSEAEDTLAGNLSHGDQKVLDIAIALASDPKILLLDEPTAGMHPERRRDTMALIQQLWRERSMTVLFIEHDMDIVFEIARLIRVLHQGRLIAEGPPAEISANRFVVEAYLGEAVS